MPDAAFPPLPHQQEGTVFLRDHEAAALFDEQGLGKSKQLIDAICQDVEARVLDGALIVCPNSIKSTWAEEDRASLKLALCGFWFRSACQKAGFPEPEGDLLRNQL